MTYTGAEVWHGKSHGYTVYRCRCEACKEAGRKHNRKQYLNRVMMDKDDSDPRHGTVNFYVNFACRCERCREVGTEYMKEQRRKRRLREQRRQ